MGGANAEGWIVEGLDSNRQARRVLGWVWNSESLCVLATFGRPPKVGGWLGTEGGGSGWGVVLEERATLCCMQWSRRVGRPAAFGVRTMPSVSRLDIRTTLQNSCRGVWCTAMGRRCQTIQCHRGAPGM